MVGKNRIPGKDGYDFGGCPGWPECEETDKDSW